MSKKELTERWDKVKNAASILENNPKEIQGFFPEIDGLLDFRGFRIKNFELINVELRGIDFSYADLSNLKIENSILRNCKFLHTNLENLLEGNNIFVNIDFSGCNFTNSGIGYEGSIYDSCFFKNCKFLKSTFIRPHFSNCEFNSKIRNLDFKCSSFENVIFKNILKDCWFRGNFPSSIDRKMYGEPKKLTFKNVSFEDVDFSFVEFSHGCTEKELKIPKGSDYLFIARWQEGLKNLEYKISYFSKSEQNQIQIFLNIANRFSTIKQEWYILNKKDWRMNLSEELIEKIWSILSKF